MCPALESSVCGKNMSLMSSEGSIPCAAASYPFGTRLASCGSQAAGVCWSAIVLMLVWFGLIDADSGLKAV